MDMEVITVNNRPSTERRHLCPDCRLLQVQGRDRLGLPMPCFRCFVARLLKALHADEVEPITRRRKRRVWLAEGGVEGVQQGVAGERFFQQNDTGLQRVVLAD